MRALIKRQRGRAICARARTSSRSSRSACRRATAARLVARLDRNRQSGLGNDEDAGAGPDGRRLRGRLHQPGRAVAAARHGDAQHLHPHAGPRRLLRQRARVRQHGRRRRGPPSRSATAASPARPGDVIEQLALGTNARLRLRLDDVVATGSTGFAGSGFGDTVVIPGNNGDCLIAASGGAGNVGRPDAFATARSPTAPTTGSRFGSAVANGAGPTTELRPRRRRLDRSPATAAATCGSATSPSSSGSR